MTDHLSLPLRLPDTHHDAYERLDEFVQHVATRVLHYRWTPKHLEGIANADYLYVLLNFWNPPPSNRFTSQSLAKIIMY